MQVFSDQEFRADTGNLDDFKAAKILDSYVEDLCFGFLDLRSMLMHFPQEGAWKEGKLLTMHREMLAANSEPIPRGKSSTRVSRKALECALGEAKREVIVLTNRFGSERDQLLARIHELETENSKLRAKIAELGGVVSSGAVL